MTKPLHLSLFSGIGGIDLAAEWAGFQTVAFCEKDPFCRKVLAKHWPDVPIVEDVHDFDGKLYAGAVALVSGGFPCQPFASVGPQRGLADERHLWPEMLRIVRECQPSWVLGENVADFIGMALESVASDLESLGYQVGTIVLPAGSVGAPQLRHRCFVVAYTEGNRMEIATRENAGAVIRPGWQGGVDPFGNLADMAKQGPGIPVADADRWASEPRLDRVATRIPARVDRLRALGNAVVPQQVYPILREIRRYC